MITPIILNEHYATQSEFSHRFQEGIIPKPSDAAVKTLPVTVENDFTSAAFVAVKSVNRWPW